MTVTWGSCGHGNVASWLPVFVSGPPPVGIGHLQDGVLLILIQLQVLWRHGRVVVLCCDGHAYRGSLRLRRLRGQSPARFLLNRQRQDGGGVITKAVDVESGMCDCLHLCRGRRKRFPGCSPVGVPGKSCSWHGLGPRWRSFSDCCRVSPKPDPQSHHLCYPAPCSPWLVWPPGGSTARPHPSRNRDGTSAGGPCCSTPLQTGKHRHLPSHQTKLFMCTFTRNEQRQSSLVNALTVFKGLYPSGTGVLILCKNVQRPLVIHDLRFKKKKCVWDRCEYLYLFLHATFF